MSIDQPAMPVSIKPHCSNSLAADPEYRCLGIDFSKDESLYDVFMYGPLVGPGIHF
jgi:hypothetical protein